MRCGLALQRRDRLLAMCGVIDVELQHLIASQD